MRITVVVVSKIPHAAEDSIFVLKIVLRLNIVVFTQSNCYGIIHVVVTIGKNMNDRMMICLGY